MTTSFALRSSTPPPPVLSDLRAVLADLRDEPPAVTYYSDDLSGADQLPQSD